MDMATFKEQRKNLTPIQDKFVGEYLKDPSDGGQAYMRAHGGDITKKSAVVQASKLLSQPKIQEALKFRARNVLGLLEARIIQNVEFWLDIRDDKSNRAAERMKASEYLAKYMNMFIEKKEIDITAQVKIVDDI